MCGSPPSPAGRAVQGRAAEAVSPVAETEECPGEQKQAQSWGRAGRTVQCCLFLSRGRGPGVVRGRGYGVLVRWTKGLPGPVSQVHAGSAGAVAGGDPVGPVSALYPECCPGWRSSIPNRLWPRALSKPCRNPSRWAGGERFLWKESEEGELQRQTGTSLLCFEGAQRPGDPCLLPWGTLVPLPDSGQHPPASRLRLRPCTC